MQFRIVLLTAALCLGLSSVAQQTVSQNAKEAAPASPVQQMVAKQFGPDFTADTKYQPLRGDFDGDGTEDVALIAICKNPLGGSGAFNYKVSDPYDGYFGIGDPKITTKFATFGDGSNHCMLMIHDWKAETPKAKWVIVNVPFAKISSGQITWKKRTVAAVTAIEEDGLNSYVFFDGKKYRWEPGDFQDKDMNP